MSNGQYPPPPPGSAPAKSGPPWGKIALGCGCLVLVVGAVVVGFTWWAGKKVIEKGQEALAAAQDPAKMAEFMVEQNPDLEVVENDKDAGVLKIRNKKTGEVTSFNYADIQSGKISIEGADGKTVDIGTTSGENGGGVTFTGPDGKKVEFGAGSAADVPSWVPLYPDANETTSAMRTDLGNELSGLVTQSTGDDMAKVKKYYEDYFAREGYKITATFSGGAAGQQGAILNAEKGAITVAIALGASGSETNVNVTYKGPK